MPAAIEVSKAVQSQLRRAIATHNLILELHPEGTWKSTGRNKIFHSLCDLAVEHFGAIVRLAGTGQHFGSAFALWRPLIETRTRAFWVLFVARDEELISIAKRKQEFPSLSKADSILAEFFKRNHNVKVFGMDRRVVSRLHGFTHSGLEQIVHRFHPDRGIKPEYRDKDIIELLNHAAREAVMVSIQVLQQSEGSDDRPAPKAIQLKDRFLKIAASWDLQK